MIAASELHYWGIRDYVVSSISLKFPLKSWRLHSFFRAPKNPDFEKEASTSHRIRSTLAITIKSLLRVVKYFMRQESVARNLGSKLYGEDGCVVRLLPSSKSAHSKSPSSQPFFHLQLRLSHPISSQSFEMTAS